MERHLRRHPHSLLSDMLKSTTEYLLSLDLKPLAELHADKPRPLMPGALYAVKGLSTGPEWRPCVRVPAADWLTARARTYAVKGPRCAVKGFSFPRRCVQATAALP